jgi:hypothetical protein
MSRNETVNMNPSIQRRETYLQSRARRRAALKAHATELGAFLRDMGIDPLTIDKAIGFARKDPESDYNFEPRKPRRGKQGQVSTR